MAETTPKIKIVSTSPVLFLTRPTICNSLCHGLIDERSSTRFICCYLSNSRRNTHDRKRSEMDANEKVRHLHSFDMNLKLIQPVRRWNFAVTGNHPAPLVFLSLADSARVVKHPSESTPLMPQFSGRGCFSRGDVRYRVTQLLFLLLSYATTLVGDCERLRPFTRSHLASCFHSWSCSSGHTLFDFPLALFTDLSAIIFYNSS